MTELFSGEEIKEKVKGYSFSDEATLGAMKKVYSENDYLLDPHGAVGYLALLEYLKTSDNRGIVLETAHPCKFMDVVKNVTDIDILPDSAQALMQKQKKSVKMEVDYEVFKDYLLQ
jgi:threonine synthase